MAAYVGLGQQGEQNQSSRTHTNQVRVRLGQQIGVAWEGSLQRLDAKLEAFLHLRVMVAKWIRQGLGFNRQVRDSGIQECCLVSRRTS
jgi:hypothetical protein